MLIWIALLLVAAYLFVDWALSVFVLYIDWHMIEGLNPWGVATIFGYPPLFLVCLNYLIAWWPF